MQEPETMRESGAFHLAKYCPIGIVISQEKVAPRRVQVRLPELHTGVEDEDLPFFRVLQSNDVSGHNGRAGKYSTLTPGTQVMVMLYDSRGYNGLVMGNLGNTSNDIQAENIYGYWDDAGNRFDVAEDGTMTLTNKAGAVVSIDPTGAIAVKAPSLDLHIGDITITSDMLTALVTTMNTTADDWTVSANSPVINDSSGIGGGSGSEPTLTPPTLAEPPDVANKTDI